MTREEFIKKLEAIDGLLMEVEKEDLTDYARAQAHYSIESAIDFLRENEENDNW